MQHVPTEEYSWLIKHPEIEEKYTGEWIAVHGKKVVAHGFELEKVLDQVADVVPPPHITYVEEVNLVAYT